MIIDTLNEKALARLKHTDGNLNGDYYSVERLVNLENRIINMEKNADTCRLSLEGYCEAKAISTWFHTEDLRVFKHWCYNKSKLYYIGFNPPHNRIRRVAGAYYVLEGMWYLISDHEELIKWCANLDSEFYEKDIANKNISYFYTKQFFLALRGDWDTLGERCERIIADPPKNGNGKSYMIDQHFYLALAKGDVIGMEAVIKELVTPRRLANKEGLEQAYTRNLISTPAIIYSKLAWRNGYEVVVDSPYIPKEWLPIKPLETYEDSFEFMKAYTIST
jgi:hypothetical protein